MLQVKAKEIANELGISDFQASNGWLEAFRVRNSISFRVLCGESASADSNLAEDWKRKLSSILKEYSAKNQFNADETGLFYRQLTTKSLVEKNEKCFGGKLPKERLTVLFCCSSTGEKLMPLVIGNAANPRAFKKNGVKKPENLPVIWKNNKKAWMNSKIFEEWIQTVNSKMKSENRKIILLIDNVSSHTSVNTMSNVEIQFLPPNLTSLVQPLDQGIINAVKQNYRKLMLNSLITNAEECKGVSDFTKSVTVYDAIRWITTAWKNLPSSTIVKSFHMAGFPKQEIEIENCENNSLEEMKMIANLLPKNIQTELVLSETSVSSFDNELIVHEVIGDSPEEILSTLLVEIKNSDGVLLESEESDEESSEDLETEKAMSFKEALDSVKKLQHFAAQKQPEITEKLFNIYSEIERNWVQSKLKASHQAAITDFFKNQ